LYSAIGLSFPPSIDMMVASELLEAGWRGRR
jgi:hypothetical protein